MSRVLLADDSPQALRLAEQILASEAIEVVSVTDGATALRRLEDVRPDVLITDVYLPTRNGFELARYLRSQAQHRHIGVIFAASLSDSFDEQDARNAGADVILRKPFEASALLGAVEKLASQARAADRLNLDSAAGAGTAGQAVDRHSIRAAVTLAIDSATPALIDELTDRVLLALAHRG